MTSLEAMWDPWSSRRTVATTLAKTLGGLVWLMEKELSDGTNLVKFGLFPVDDET